ncbi:unnamed protein product [Acanthoscelides obtectus]|uniref:Uncharacterized protein n=1 Tax=Acanthoscelides obtectus TaxID=200917 RepID=A0A9P0M2B1_ACAOB|nr:unnamed protein product [Acanthoscelides obtectus]CAK1664148.1 hypothetical protein AOBTE_LOCUS24082 [Acanthoscelides obtectus]
MRPKTVEVRKPCPVEAATSQQYAQLGDWMQHQQQLHVYNSRNRSQLPARYLMDGTYAVMTPTKTSDVAKPSQPSITYPSYAAQSGDTQQKRAGKSIAYATVTPTALRSPSPHARAASATRSESTYQHQNTAAVRPLQQYEPRKSPPLAATRQQQQQQQRYASSEHQAAVDGQWAEEVAHQRAYSKANESRYRSPNMNQHLYTSTH